MAATFDLSNYRNRQVKDARGPAYFAWLFAVVLGVVALLASGLIKATPLGADRTTSVATAVLSLFLVAFGVLCFQYPARRIRPIHLELEPNLARFRLAEGGSEEIRWPSSPASDVVSTKPTMRISDWSSVPGIAAQDMYSVVYWGSQSEIRAAPLTPEAFAAILESWRTFGCRVAEERRPPRGRKGSVTFYSV